MSTPALFLALCTLGLPTGAHAQAAPRPEPYALRGVRVERAADGRTATIVLRDGRIEALLEPEATLPPGLRIVEGAGLLALPAFVDAYAQTGCSAPAPEAQRDKPVDVTEDVAVDMRSANRKGIAAALSAADVLTLDQGIVDAWTEQGFGVLLSAPSGQLLSGASTLVGVREAAARDLIQRDRVHAHAAFQASGPGYPSTLMGYHAQLRQFFLDAERHAELARRQAAALSGPRPAYDLDLEAVQSLLDGEQRLVCEAESATDIERWLRLGAEFELQVGISGGRDAGKLAERLAAEHVPVVLTLDWGEEVPDPVKEDEKKAKRMRTDDAAWTYVEPFGARAERRRLWEESRDSAIRLHEAGVRLAFGSGGRKPKELLKNVRALIEAGLPAEAALDGLTAGAAAAVGAEQRLGRIAAGLDATLTLWSADPLTDDKAEPVWVFVDGYALERERKKDKHGGSEGPAEGVSAAGHWTLVLEGEEVPEAVTLELEMEEDGTVTGSYAFTLPGQAPASAGVEGRLSASELTLEGEVTLEGETASFEITATIEGDTLEGSVEVEIPGMDEPIVHPFHGTRDPRTARAQGASR
jgi:imidazolonepropionase-like amidohydrolase